MACQAGAPPAAAATGPAAESVCNNPDAADGTTRCEILRTLIDRVLMVPEQICVVDCINFICLEVNLQHQRRGNVFTFVGGVPA